jgi:glycosyltransferase involved in cell wall biosynthesis
VTVPGEVLIIGSRDDVRASGGQESYARAHALTARAAGYRTTFVCLGHSAGVFDTGFGPIVRVRAPIRPHRQVIAPLHAPWVVPAIVRRLEGRAGPHVLHGYGVWGWVVVAAARALRRRGIEAVPVVTLFDLVDREARTKLLSPVLRGEPWLRARSAVEAALTHAVSARWERRGARGARVVVVNYDSVRRDAVAAYGPGLDVRRLTYAAPAAFAPMADLRGGREPRALEELENGEAPLVLATSRHDGRKGVDVLIRALARLRDDGVRFRACLLGGGNLLEHHRQLARELGLAGQVAIPGRVPEILPFLGRADAFAFPSLAEGSGALSVLEALRAGLAIVSTGVDGLEEDLTHERDSLLVPAGDPAPLAAALRRLIEDAPLRARLGAAARELHERRFSAGAAAADLAALYTELGVPPAGADEMGAAGFEPATSRA